MKDQHNRTKPMTVIAPVALTTTAGKMGKVIDRRGYNGVELLVSYGTLTSTTAVIAVTVFESDSSTTGSLTSVADSDLIGTELLAGLPAGTRTSGVSTGKNITKRIGYKGSKRYVGCKIVPTGTAAPVVCVIANLHSPSVAPTTNP